MYIIICPNCGKSIAVPDNTLSKPRCIRCPHEECGFIDYETSFDITTEDNSLSAISLYESASRLASDPRLIVNENIDMIARNSSCSHSTVIWLINSLLDNTTVNHDPLMKKQRFAILERAHVSLDDLMERLNEIVQAKQVKAGNNISHDMSGKDYRSMYLDLQKAYERLESEKNNMRDKVKAFASENDRLKEMLGV